MLFTMFSKKEWEKNEEYKLDCDHRYFRVVINYLRHNELIIEKNLSKQGVLSLAKFFQIQGLIDLLSSDGTDLFFTLITTR
jgi:hypothetical protein